MKDNYTKSEVQEMREAAEAKDLIKLAELIIGQPLVEKEPETVEPWSVWENERNTLVFVPENGNTGNLVGIYTRYLRKKTTAASEHVYTARSPQDHLDTLAFHSYKLIGHATPSFTIKPV